ncbi:MAG TPA: carboxypeptidase-like regulatory domain-containing protein, partial [Candidatus Eremiobacteraceae bacterium]|nr:carboxypeptidase-like regulatory domain-containing protein [Candidatus Eremiobacteraceae bacterium]
MSVRTTSFFVILLGHLLLLKTSSAQLAPANATYTLRGTVINSVTDEPIQRVLVELSGDHQRHFLTGADGKFEFQNVPPGLTAIGLQKPGYFPAQTLSRKGSPALVTVGPDQPPAVLRL